MLKMYSPSGHPRRRGVCFFIRKDLEKFNITSLAHSPVDPVQWMGAVRMRVQTADKNITIIHTSPSVNVLWNKKLGQMVELCLKTCSFLLLNMLFDVLEWCGLLVDFWWHPFTASKWCNATFPQSSIWDSTFSFLDEVSFNLDYSVRLALFTSVRSALVWSVL